MSKPLLSLQWCRLFQCSPKVHMLRHGAPVTAVNAQPSKRAFHTTPIWSARPRRSPRARHLAENPTQGQRWRTKEGLRIDGSGLVIDHLTSDVSDSLNAFNQNKKALYEFHQTLMPPGINLETFDRVIQEIIVSAHSKLPTANTIRAISVDVDALFRMSLFLGLSDAYIPKAHNIFIWAQSACARAGSRRAIVHTVSYYLRHHSDIQLNTECIAQLKDLALHDEFPPAITLYIQILLWRGDYAGAVDLLKNKIVPYTKPSLVPPHPLEDLTLGGSIDPPVRMASLALSQTHGLEDMKAAMMHAAIEYHDPVALTDLAILFLETSDWDGYESNMSIAAVTGHLPACLYLANFYYKISQGEIPTLAERRAAESGEAENPGKGPSWVQSIVKWADGKINPFFSREDYRKHAIDWYELAWEMGDGAAGLILAILLRQDGLVDAGRAVYTLAKERGLPANVPRKGLVELEDRWDDVSFEPGLPPKLMALK
ncbi:uncharacterized protein N7515_000119 [Penicillium bovifimosum]|uniref:Uncharacterized protein n=1 Tax=Penicillium bovifimosum TaxID=126998 RepID=A0A9W9LB50_9EURO|nr:uncharacterized protein N7515_000119 [Penicillium bovifimosum]KAJ5145555.1 hypothetical protein N7515_000119 [Penicillium bovifimosum]